MTSLDWIVLIVYFAAMAGIGIWSMRRIRVQEDFFMGGRSFGKLIQMFAAFGAGTGSADPINTGRTTFTSGLSGMWSVMYWLFVTSIYWFAGVWFRRMRHLTLGDWFAERYESRGLGAAYAIFGLVLYMVYISMLFSAISKFAAPLIDADSVMLFGTAIKLEYVLVPVIALVVILYGVLGGITAAYMTDLIQGLFIILLSLLLIPFGLSALVDNFGDPQTMGFLQGFRIMHERLPEAYFTLIGSTYASEFPLYRIIAVVILNIIGIVVFPHFIATGGGTAKTEFNARVGLVTGNLIKRFCTVGWALTALIVLALFAGSAELAADPDRVWGVASRELLGPGLLGLMLACLLAALMSSVDCYMLVSSALIVRNLYAPFINPNATEKNYVQVGRITAAIVVVGAVIFSWAFMDVFKQLQLTWIVPILFAAPFWVAMFWRRATRTAAWTTVIFSAVFFFLIPWLTPLLAPGLRTSPLFTGTNNIVETTITRVAAPSDVQRREAAMAVWDRKAEAARAQGGDSLEISRAVDALGPRPVPLAVGDDISETFKTGGKAIYWSGRVVPAGDPFFSIISLKQSEKKLVVTKKYNCSLRAQGNFKPDFLFYHLLGMDLTSKTNAALDTLSLPVKIVLPFLVMILVSLFTRRNGKEALDRYYAKMKTEVDPDPEKDRANLAASFQDPERFNNRKLFLKSDLEFVKPRPVDTAGFVLTFAACFTVIGLILWIAGIGA